MNKLVSPVLSPTKSEFHKQLELYRQTMPYKSEYIGMHNPYDNSLIRSPADYDLYLREKLFHDMCEKAAADELQRRARKILIRASILCAAVSLLFFVWILPSAISRSSADGYDSGFVAGSTEGYSNGVSEGYDTGYNSGYNSGYSAGYQPGFSDGKSAGYETGFSDGSDAGYLQGLIDGSSTSDNSAPTKSETVYITSSGAKYHRSTCSYLHSRRAIPLSEAKALGYSACSRCSPPK